MPNHPKSTCQIFSAYRSPKSRGRCSNPNKLRFSKALGGLGIRQQRVFPQGPHCRGWWNANDLMPPLFPYKTDKTAWWLSLPL